MCVLTKLSHRFGNPKKQQQPIKNWRIKAIWGRVVGVFFWTARLTGKLEVCVYIYLYMWLYKKVWDSVEVFCNIEQHIVYMYVYIYIYIYIYVCIYIYKHIIKPYKQLSPPCWFGAVLEASPDVVPVNLGAEEGALPIPAGRSLIKMLFGWWVFCWKTETSSGSTLMMSSKSC